MNVYSLLRKLAKQSQYQNTFLVSKEIHSIRLFKNCRDLSQLQDFFINYLFAYESINQDISMKKVSEHVLDEEIFEDCYLIYKRTNSNKPEKQEDKDSDVRLVISDRIIFPKKE